MTTLLAFHNDPAVKAKYLARVESHIAADHLIRGTGWDGFRGCAVGCTLEDYDHSRYPVELGIPEWLARVEDTLFEGMTKGRAETWPRDFLAAITPGVDLERVKAPFVIHVLRSTLKNFDHEKSPAVLAAVNGSIALWERSDVGSEAWKSAAESAARSAESAAWSAESAAWSAESAAWSAESAAWSAESAAWSAAESAARSAESAAWSAESAAWSAESAAWSAESAAWSAAGSAAWSAAGSAAWSAAYDGFADALLKIISQQEPT